MEKYIVAIGNAFDGLNVYGPFDSIEDANDFGQDCGDDWCAVQLQPAKKGD